MRNVRWRPIHQNLEGEMAGLALWLQASLGRWFNIERGRIVPTEFLCRIMTITMGCPHRGRTGLEPRLCPVTIPVTAGLGQPDPL
jgi:hypothetical protein